jgi:transcriptional regulator with XRE-family HTH domain
MSKTRDIKLLKTFGERLRVLRTAKGLTLEQLAFAADIELSQVYRIETGKVNPTLTTMIVLANGLDITVAELVKDL